MPISNIGSGSYPPNSESSPPPNTGSSPVTPHTLDPQIATECMTARRSMYDPSLYRE